MEDFVLISDKSFEKVRNEIRKNKGKRIIFSSDDDELNRKILERLGKNSSSASSESQSKEKIDVLLINQSGRKDFQKQRNSGFNHVLAKLAKKNSVILGINLDEIIESSKHEKPRILARASQNIKLCNKNKIKMKFINRKPENSRNIYDLKSLGLVLGMPTWMTKNF